MSDDDASLALVEHALSVRLAVQLGDQMSARTALAEVHRLVPLLRLAVQQMPDEDEHDEVHGMVQLLVRKYPPPGGGEEVDG